MSYRRQEYVPEEGELPPLIELEPLTEDQKIIRASHRLAQTTGARYAQAFPELFDDEARVFSLHHEILILCDPKTVGSKDPSRPLQPLQPAVIEQKFRLFCIAELVEWLCPYAVGSISFKSVVHSLSVSLKSLLNHYMHEAKLPMSNKARAASIQRLTTTIVCKVAVEYPRDYLAQHGFSAVLLPRLVARFGKELMLADKAQKPATWRFKKIIEALAPVLRPFAAANAAPFIEVLRKRLREDGDFAQLSGVVLGPKGLQYSKGVPNLAEQAWAVLMNDVLTSVVDLLPRFRFSKPLKQTIGELFGVVDVKAMEELARDPTLKTLLVQRCGEAKLAIVKSVFVYIVIPSMTAPAVNPWTPRIERPVYALIGNTLMKLITAFEDSPIEHPPFNLHPIQAQAHTVQSYFSNMLVVFEDKKKL